MRGEECGTRSRETTGPVRAGRCTCWCRPELQRVRTVLLRMEGLHLHEEAYLTSRANVVKARTTQIVTLAKMRRRVLHRPTEDNIRRRISMLWIVGLKSRCEAGMGIKKVEVVLGYEQAEKASAHSVISDTHSTSKGRHPPQATSNTCRLTCVQESEYRSFNEFLDLPSSQQAAIRQLPLLPRRSPRSFVLPWAF